MLLEYLNKTDNWIEELAKPPYSIKISEKDGYYLLKYDQLNSDFANPLVLECRGSIVAKKNGQWVYVCNPFTKFFNYGEGFAADINWRTASVQEKVDGSLIKFWYDDVWHISTNGKIDAFDAPTADILYPTFGAVVLAALTNHYDDYHTDFFGKLDRRYTYMFELVSPYTKVVIDYSKTELYFLGWKETATGDELDPMDCVLSHEFPVPKRYPMTSLAEVVDAAAALPSNEEGYVCCDNKFNRIKVKSPLYVAIAHMGNNGVITSERLIDLILKNEVDEFLTYYNEYSETVLNLQIAMQKANLHALQALAQVQLMYKCCTKTRKDYAHCVQKICVNDYVKYRDYCFKNYDNEIGFSQYTSHWTAAKWVEFLK